MIKLYDVTLLRPAAIGNREGYYDEGRDWGADIPSLPSMHEQALVRRHGGAVALELFDAVPPDQPFHCTELIGRLITIKDLSPKTQHCILSAVCRWLLQAPESADPDKRPLIRKMGNRYAL